jgi:hypothetical protein
VIAAVLIVMVLGAVWAGFQSQQVPEYYQRAKVRTAEHDAKVISQPRDHSESSEDHRPSKGSEHKLNRLLETLTRADAKIPEAEEWLAQLTGETSTMRIREVFNEDDVNLWLARELPQRFHYCLPPGVSDPRVEFSNGRGRVGFRYQQNGFEGVVTLDVEAAMTGQGSQLGIRLHGISVGALSLPVGKLLDLISDAAVRSQGPSYNGPEVIRWTQQGGDPVALLPGSGPGGGYFNSLESFSLQNGQLEVVIKRQPYPRR